MTEAPLTIALPFHRGVAFLREAVESVFLQEDSRWRLVVGDDGEAGSRDSEEARAYVAGLEDPRVTYIRNPVHLGMVGNWNRLLATAETDLVCLLHQDDRLATDYVGLVRSLAETHPEAAAFYCGARIIDAEGAPVFSLADAVKALLVPGWGRRTHLAGRPAVEALLRGNFIMCPTLCYRRTRLNGLAFDPRFRQVQDLDLLLRVLLGGSTIEGTRRVAYVYRRHRASATSMQSKSLLRFEEERDLLDEMAEICALRGWTQAARIARGKRVVKLHLGYRALEDLRGGSVGRAWAKWRLARTF